jgi:acyl carrier protein
MQLQDIINDKFKAALEQSDAEVPVALDSEMVLLGSGLDSLGFAILVTTLEDELGYDPFTLMEDAFYPRTYGEFVGIYEKYASHAKDGIIA